MRTADKKLLLDNCKNHKQESTPRIHNFKNCRNDTKHTTLF